MKKIIVAVSGGPDSMALLHMLSLEGFEIIVAHVNYNVRSNSHLDEKLVRDYCLKHKIELQVLSAPKHESGNFQAFAREIRYEFMVDLAKKHKLEEIYVAHHLDDVLETYIMQKARNSVPTYYGINKYSNYYGLKIVRPLLDYKKTDLINYCQANQIEYVIDKSNLENDYSRNKIRNTILELMSDAEKAVLLKEIQAENLNLAQVATKVEENYQTFIANYSLNYLLSLSDSDMILLVRRYFKSYDIYNISNLEYENILQFLKAKGNGEYTLNDEYSLYKSYGQLALIENENSYSYEISEIEFKDYPNFALMSSGTSENALTLSKQDFPITIRNYQPGDKIQMRFGRKSLARFFIDKKIPDYERKVWPVVLNADKEIILVPGLGCNITHFSNNPTVFVVK